MPKNLCSFTIPTQTSKGQFPSPDRKGGDKNKNFIRCFTLLAVASIPLTLIAFTDERGTGQKVNFIKGQDKIDITIDGKFLTSYHFGSKPYKILDKESKSDGGFLTKPVLHPILSPSGIVLTRGYPLVQLPGESSDHPHHVGLFFTYGSEGEVNGEEFWSTTRPGSIIEHRAITKAELGIGKGKLSTRANWTAKDGKVLLVENRDMIFYAGEDEYVIDFHINLTAQKEKVTFKDTKEGLFAIRVAPWLRETSGSDWVKGISGTAQYLSSTGQRTEKNVWAKRAKWMRLQGKKDDKTIGVAILNHPSSVNYPTYWHARGYGLFAANPLGQLPFQKARKEKNPQPFNFTLEPNQTAYFGFRLILYEGPRTKEQIEQQFKDFKK